MPYTLSETHTFSIDNESYVTRSYVHSDNRAVAKPTVPAALAGKLSTRTDETTGVVTLTAAAAAPPLAVGDLVDVYFDGGQLVNAEVSAIAGADVTIATDVGDTLPAEGAAVNLAVPVVATLEFAGDDALGFAVKGPTTAAALVVFLDAPDPAGPPLLAVELGPGEGKAWSSAGDDANPLAGVTVAAVRFSHGDPAGAATCSATVLTG